MKGIRLRKLRILQAELKMTIRLTPDSERIPFRAFLTYERGYHLDISLYREVTNQVTGQTVFQTYTVGKPGPLDGVALYDPYVTKGHLQYKRFTAQSNNTTYAYDFPDMFRQALLSIWKQYLDKNKLKDYAIPKETFSYQELILDTTNPCKKKLSISSSLIKQIFLFLLVNSNDASSLLSPTIISSASVTISQKTSQSNEKESLDYLKRCGLLPRTCLQPENDCGIVAWRIHMKTPECPSGRRVIVIANDITYKIGSFGIEEDLLFQRASELSRLERIPRIYISANSGARIGLAEELKSLYHVAWNDPNDIDKGVKYLYLTPGDYSCISHMNCIRTEVIHEDGEMRYKIIDIIGRENSLGVENLRGSGMIAGETSHAYNLIVSVYIFLASPLLNLKRF